jgi:RNA polymerase sigma-70 factor (ECF subfamily)
MGLWFGHFGESRALRDKLEGYRSKMLRAATSWCGDPVLASDLVQESLTRALARQHQLREIEKLGPWLFQILNNCWREHLRRSRPSIDIDDLVLCGEHDAMGAAVQEQLVERVRRAVAELPMGQRQVVTLVDLAGCSYAEVAEVLEVPIGTVMSRLSRARNALKDKLVSYRDEIGSGRSYLRRVK